MVEVPKTKDPDLIDKKEYRKRRMALFSKHGALIQDFTVLVFTSLIIDKFYLF
ncbi:MAG: hypothetical protein ACFFDK_19195 [Promethearchaeota archaeon]